jgi:cytochrome o ubiquinol oxidase subunit IV
MKQAYSENMGAGGVTSKNYITGFILAVLLTVISFGLVITRLVPQQVVVIGIFAAALVQMLVHLHFFLHLNRSSAQCWNVMAMAFTALMLSIFVVGTIWIMHTLNTRMM